MVLPCCAKLTVLSDFSVSLWKEQMESLNLPAFDARIMDHDGQSKKIWDDFRKKYIALTPEEWVRQHMLHFLAGHRGFPASLIKVEAALTYNKMKKRSDIVAYGSNGKPVLVVECKAPQIEISQGVFDQAAMYNVSFSGNYLVVTNGMEHFCCVIDHANKKWKFLQDIPHYSDICDSKHDNF